jgi:hypothetical protein
MRHLAGLSLVRWLAALLLLGASLPAGAFAQAAPGAVVPDSLAATPASAEQALAESRELLKAGDYDRAIEMLRAALASGPHATALRRDLYLQLIKTYVTLGNDLRFRPQGRETSNLNYGAARDLVVECLTAPALRHTRPEPVSDYPPEMVQMFSEVRAERFGAFRVVGLEPPGATVLFDGDTLRYAADGTCGDEDIAAGPHQVTVAAPRHRTHIETVEISPGATLERNYTLRERPGLRWYLVRGAVAVAAAVGLGILIAQAGDEGATSGPAALPPAPPPPSR